MYKSIEKKTFFAYFLYLFLIVLLWIKLFHATYYIKEGPHSFVLDSLIQFNQLSELSVFIIKGITFTILIFLQYLIYKSMSYVPKSTLTYPFIFIINSILGLCSSYDFIDILQLLFIILFIIFLGQTSKKNKTTSSFFNLGFLYGIFLFISLKFIILFPILLLSINIFGKSNQRDFWAYFFGFISVVYLSTSMLYLTGNIHLLKGYFSLQNLFQYKIVNQIDIILCLIAIGSLFAAFPKITTYNINTRKIYMMISFMCFIYLVISIFFQQNNTKPFLSLMMISSLYISSFISGLRSNKAKSIILSLGIIVAIFSAFFL